MANRTLSRDELAFGRAVLLATDSVGLSAEGAFWLYDKESDVWRYFLVTSLFNKIGPREIFYKLDKALSQRLSEHELKEFSLHIADPNEDFIQSICGNVTTTPFASEPLPASIRLNGSHIDAVIYRMSGKLSDKAIKTARRRFSRLYKEMVAV